MIYNIKNLLHDKIIIIMIFKRLIIGILQIITLVTMVTKVRRVIYTSKVANLRTFVTTLVTTLGCGQGKIQSSPLPQCCVSLAYDSEISAMLSGVSCIVYMLASYSVR